MKEKEKTKFLQHKIGRSKNTPYRKKYEFDGEDDCGINVHEQGGRTFVEINCRLDSYYIDDPYDKYEDYEDYDDDDDCEEDEGETESLFVAENELLNLLYKFRIIFFIYLL